MLVPRRVNFTQFHSKELDHFLFIWIGLRWWLREQGTSFVTDRKRHYYLWCQGGARNLWRWCMQNLKYLKTALHSRYTCIYIKNMMYTSRILLWAIVITLTQYIDIWNAVGNARFFHTWTALLPAIGVADTCHKQRGQLGVRMHRNDWPKAPGSPYLRWWCLGCVFHHLLITKRKVL